LSALPERLSAQTVILDNGAAGTSSLGNWRSSGALGWYGTDSVYAGKTDAGWWYRFAVNLPSPGEYEVSLWWTRLTSRETHVPVDVTHASGTAAVTVDQTQNGGRWNPIGRWGFTAQAIVIIHSLGEGQSTCADAVRLVKVGELVSNTPPIATIVSLMPSPANRWQVVTASGTGSDPDTGAPVTEFRWTSSLNGDLASTSIFSTEALSEGTHTISLRVRDAAGAWSLPDTEELVVRPNTRPVARIDSIEEDDGVIDFAGSAQDPDAGAQVADWEWRSNVDGDLSRSASFSLPASWLTPGTHTISLRVLDNAGAWSLAAATLLTIAGPAAPAEIILDNGQPGTSSTGTWQVSTALNPYGANSVYAAKTAAGATYTFRVDVPAAGDYEVHAWWTQLSSRETNVPIDVVHGGGTQTVTVDQTRNGGRWNLLGRWTFATTATVRVRSLGLGKSTCADAVRLVRLSAPDSVSGLDARPPNPACTLLERPGSTAGARLIEPFPDIERRAHVMRQRPGDNSRWYLVNKAGTVHRFANDPAADRLDLVLSLQDRIEEINEGGLVGFVFHPNFPVNDTMYVLYTSDDGDYTTHISRLRSRDGGDTIDPASEEILFVIPQRNQYHKGGGMHFGADGYLYISIGDSGRSSSAQDLNALTGKIIRIDVDVASGYRIPPDNPLAAGGGRPELFAWGFRNPWQFSFDRLTGEIWAGDVGAESWEEVNRVVRGGNYGWAGREGPDCYNEDICDNPAFIAPYVAHPPSEARAVIGGFVYRGSAVPDLYGAYIYADWSSGRIYAIRQAGGAAPLPEVLFETGRSIFSLAEDQAGEIFIVASDRTIYKIVPDTTGGVDDFPRSLSDVPCFDSMNPAEPGSGLIPYDINAPLWSDGAEKERYMAIPDGKTITVLPDGDFEFPIGTVLAKSFLLGGRIIETRLLARHADGSWGGYSYEWNDAGTDATLLEDGKTKLVSGVLWTYPSRSQCFSCHTEAAVRALGPEIAQLNRDFTYPATGRTANQLATLEAIGLLSAPLPGAPADLPRLAAPLGPATVELKARAYLHSNCSNCHRPGNPIGPTMDLRHDTLFGAMGICNEPPTAGDLGVPGARLLVPGNPALSVLSLRMHLVGTGQMPPLARSLVDPTGTSLVDQWITALQGCP
jgi:uncharacterized repeat protein (TIGR03806 family)